MMRAAMAKKCARSFPLDLLDVNQAEVGLVHERRRLKAVAAALSSQVPASEPVELGVDESRELVHGGPIPYGPPDQQARNVMGRATDHTGPPVALARAYLRNARLNHRRRVASPLESA